MLSVAPAAALLAPTTRLGAAARVHARMVAPTDQLESVGARIPIDEAFPGMRQVHADPDVFVIENFLDSASCDDMVARAEPKLRASPVAYAGWTQDFSELFELAAKGPCLWFALIGAWFQAQGDVSFTKLDLAVHTLQNYALLLALAAGAIAAFTKARTSGLQELRTSTSTTLDDLGAEDGRASGAGTFVRRAARLLGGGEESPAAELEAQARLFEAPTIIRYEAGQALAPHYDANRAATTEDADRGGQTLATLIVYLNDVRRGGLTRFGKLQPAAAGAAGAKGFGAPPPSASAKRAPAEGLTVQPRKGDALLFFPADAAGTFDERTEHEGCPAVDEKYIARIWRHQQRVRPPYGLAESQLAKLGALDA